MTNIEYEITTTLNKARAIHQLIRKSNHITLCYLDRICKV